jgi:hypothetical protein
MVNAAPRIRRAVTALALVSALGFLPVAGASPLSRLRGGEPEVVQRQVERTFVQHLWSLLTGFWAKAGAKIDGNG